MIYVRKNIYIRIFLNFHSYLKSQKKVFLRENKRVSLRKYRKTSKRESIRQLIPLNLLNTNNLY